MFGCYCLVISTIVGFLNSVVICISFWFDLVVGAGIAYLYGFFRLLVGDVCVCFVLWLLGGC